MDDSWARFIYNCLWFALAFYSIGQILGTIRAYAAGEKLRRAAGGKVTTFSPGWLCDVWSDEGLHEACELLRRHFRSSGKGT